MNPSKSIRIESIDILRGVVMVLMALDHVRDYFHIDAFNGNYPENMDRTYIFFFATRFVTHFCAPVFIFLAGTSAFLYGQKRSQKELSKFLITRGLWLIFVEIFINNFLWWFDVSFGFTNLQVIWAIGVSMIVLGIVSYLPKRVLLVLGLLIVFGHNLLDGIVKEGNSLESAIWYFLHQINGISYAENRFVWFSYPVLPWIGVMILGYLFGEFYRKDADATQRKKLLQYLGIGCILLFFVLRSTNVYGDLHPWTEQATTEKTIISFFNVHKYPPSLSFLLITLGPAFLFLNFIEKIKNKITDIFIVFGRVPFFYYVLHIFVIHGAAVLGLILTGKDWKLMILDSTTLSQGLLAGYGYSLGVVYIVWIGIVAFLYPICKRYMNYKKNNKHKWWLSYL